MIRCGACGRTIKVTSGKAIIPNSGAKCRSCQELHWDEATWEGSCYWLARSSARASRCSWVRGASTAISGRSQPNETGTRPPVANLR